MKKSKITKLMSLLLCTVMLFSTIVSSTNINILQNISESSLNVDESDPSQIFTGSITSDADIDLSGIEVKVYSSELVGEEFGAEFYGGRYEYSVYTDTNGEFAFNKPSERCSYTIELSSLPEDYGISEYSVDIEPGENTGTVELSPIASVDTYLDDNNVFATFTDLNGDVLYVDYESVPDESIAAQNTVIDINATEVNYLSVKNMNNVTLNGRIVTSGSFYEYSMVCDISDFDPLDKIDILYSMGKITEEEKYSLYSVYLETDAANYETCLTALSYETSSYYAENSEIVSTYEFTEDPPTFDAFETVKITDDYSVNVCYNIGFNENYIDLVCEKVYAVYTTLFQELFYSRYPATSELSAGQMVHDIYLTEPGESGEFGETFYNIYSGYTYVLIYTNFFGDVGYQQRLESTIAHELAHSILIEYKVSPSTNHWFHEGLSTAIAFEYTRSLDDFVRSRTNAYIQNSSQSIYTLSDNAERGTMLLFHYIYENYGGWKALNAIISNLQFTDSVYEALTITYNGVTYDYVDAFAGMAACNYNSKQLYTFSPKTTGFEWDKPTPRVINTDKTIENLSVNPMAFEYNKYINDTATPCNVKSKIEVDGRTTTITIAVIAENETGELTIANKIFRDYDNLTISVNDLGEGKYKSLIMIPINVNTSGDAIPYWVRSTIYTDEE